MTQAGSEDDTNSTTRAIWPASAGRHRGKGIASVTYTYEREDADGNAIEQHTYSAKVAAQRDLDEVVSQRYRMSDGAIVTAQADIDIGGQTY